MANWGFWEWLTYISIGLAAAVLALDAAVKGTSNLLPSWRFILDSQIWRFAPIILLVISGMLICFQRVGWIGKSDVAENWNPKAHLTLTFDNQLQSVATGTQEGVRFYYWTHIPGLEINWERRETAAGPGYVIVFLALKDPTYTNYSRAVVVGGGPLCEILATHATGAVIRAIGDLRGRTLDIQFSKTPIPLY